MKELAAFRCVMRARCNIELHTFNFVLADVDEGRWGDDVGLEVVHHGRDMINVMN